MRAEQATAENLDAERTIRASALDPDPWDAGAVRAILPDLADACPDIDWSLPLASWSKETITEFLLTALRLIRAAMLARDLSEQGITRKTGASTIARQANAAAGGPLHDARTNGTTPLEFDHGHELQPSQPGARSRQRRRQRRDRARGRSQGRAAASLSRRQHRRRRLPAQSAVSTGGANRHCRPACATSSSAGIISRTSRASI